VNLDFLYFALVFCALNGIIEMPFDEFIDNWSACWEAVTELTDWFVKFVECGG